MINFKHLEGMTDEELLAEHNRIRALPEDERKREYYERMSAHYKQEEIDWKKRYTEYINSDEWKALAAKAKELAGGRCRVCNGRERLDAHHRTYERFTHEDIEDITVLCHSCHELFSTYGKLNK